MHIAMHDALNAAEPRFARWAPAAPDEPPADGASPLVAMAAAAYQVLLARHQEDAAEEADPLFRAALAAEPAGAAVDAAIRLGAAIGWPRRRATRRPPLSRGRSRRGTARASGGRHRPSS